MISTFFKLKSLNIKEYKNIKDIAINFDEKKGITVLIGKNGCGKSNILEAISSIFAGLYKNRIHKPKFDYIINYEIKGHDIEIKFVDSKYTFSVDHINNTKTEFYKKSKMFLPKNVIACYSGESQRLWNYYYWPYYREYILNIKKSDFIPELSMLYINRHNLSISLLTLFFYDFESYTDVKEFCNNKLNIKEIRNISFKYDTKKIKEWKNNSVLQMIKQLNKVDEISVLSADTITLSLNELKERLSYMGEQDFFKLLYAATMPKDDKVITNVSYELVLNNDETIGVDDLSEGEKKNILTTTILEVLADENSLLLFDEPDSHIHVSRKVELKELFDKYPNRENIITTHSPTLAVKFEGHIEGLGLDEKGHTIIIDSEKAKLVSTITEGMWNIHEQNMFLASNKPMTLLVEGKTDKIHIEEAHKHLKDRFPLLDFDVISMNTCERIKDVISGLSKSKGSDIEWGSRKIIGIFDNDGAGKDCLNKLKLSPNHSNWQKVNDSTNFYVFLLPKKDGYDDFTIENCYEPENYQDAYIEALSQKQGHFGGLSIDKISDDLKNKAKIILANRVKKYTSHDFEGFIPLFEILDKIRQL